MEITIERKGQTMHLKDMLFPECTLIHVKADRKEDVICYRMEKLKKIFMRLFWREKGNIQRD